jgi:outer membrane lipopolysaccharide assembly protein LptE/RlpB
MKKLLIPALIGLSAVTLLTGCAWSLGSGSKTVTMMPTAGQQLIDLQKARNTGAISDAEYQTQKAKILGSK